MMIMRMMMILMIFEGHRTYIIGSKIIAIIITGMFYRYLKHNLSKLSSSKK